jgi:hypothetical protein
MDPAEPLREEADPGRALRALADHLGGLLAGRSVGTVLVWSRPLHERGEAGLEIARVCASHDGALEITFKDDPSGPLRLFSPAGVVLDEDGLRVESAALLEWGGLSAQRVPPGWIRLKSEGRSAEFEIGRREALHLEPAPGAPAWLLPFDPEPQGPTPA